VRSSTPLASYGNDLDILAAGEGAQAGPEYVLAFGETFGNGMTDNVTLFGPRRHRGTGAYIPAFS
jgi:hypothetical protein